MKYLVNMSALTVSVSSFYGDSNSYKSYIFDVECHEKTVIRSLPANLNKILGPSNVWKVFRKQSELFEFLDTKANNLNLMPFTFQSLGSERLFLAAHPLVFWHFDNLRKPDERHSYEIIREHFPCKLYFDLEFNIKLNPSHDGERMIRTFSNIIFFLLKIDCSFNNVLDLDSSTPIKFSHHLIFQLPNHVFQDNSHVGYFVKTACEIILSNIYNDKIVDLTKECNISQRELLELLVIDDKEKKVLFCDQSVYSKNRHFRLYRSSKLNKKVPLLVSQNNQFNIENLSGNKDEQIFLASLITFFPVNSLLTCNIIKFEGIQSLSSATQHKNQIISSTSKNNVSPFPELDKFIEKVISPGKIWRVCYFESNKNLVYDIVGNRFCQNIGREHKSNNIMMVVDTINCIYYQKCHDYECKGFRSNEVKLPYEISFYINGDNNDIVQDSEDVLLLLEEDNFSSEDCCKFSEIELKKPTVLVEISSGKNVRKNPESNLVSKAPFVENSKCINYGSSTAQKEDIDNCSRSSKNFSAVNEFSKNDSSMLVESYCLPNREFLKEGNLIFEESNCSEEQKEFEISQFLDFFEDELLSVQENGILKSTNESKNTSVPDYGLSDSDLLKADEVVDSF